MNSQEEEAFECNQCGKLCFLIDDELDIKDTHIVIDCYPQYYCPDCNARYATIEDETLSGLIQYAEKHHLDKFNFAKYIKIRDRVRHRKSLAKTICLYLLLYLVLAIILRNYIIPVTVPTGSMLPTIQLNDRLFVDKFLYKHFGAINRKDIIVFHPPEFLNSEDLFVKRVLGLPGDVLEVRNNVLNINGEILDEPYLYETEQPDFGPIQVPQDGLFVMGDNRNHSAGSRAFEFISTQAVVGKVIMRYWPLNEGIVFK